MKNALSLLRLFLIIALNSSCATFAMGQRRQCDAPIVPPRPPAVVCIADGEGMGDCYNPVTGKSERRSMKNYVSFSASDYTRDEEWIDAILRAIEP